MPLAVVPGQLPAMPRGVSHGRVKITSNVNKVSSRITLWFAVSLDNRRIDGSGKMC